jgi:hypothetical protein
MIDKWVLKFLPQRKCNNRVEVMRENTEIVFAIDIISILYHSINFTLKIGCNQS